MLLSVTDKGIYSQFWGFCGVVEISNTDLIVAFSDRDKPEHTNLSL
jgi:hypothetical protein